MKQRLLLSLLSLSTIGSFLAAAGTVLVLNPEDRISVKRGSMLTALGFVFFLSLFDLLNAAALKTGLGARLRRRYRLSCGDVLDITNKLVSAVQAALSCVTGIVVCLWSCTRDFMRSSHFMSEAYAWFGAAYFFYDIWSMYKVHIYMTSEKLGAEKKSDKQKENETTENGEADGPKKEIVPVRHANFLEYCAHEPVILMHHLFIGGFGFLVIVYLRGGLGDCVFGFVYLMELSTPFVSIRGILSKLGLKASRAYLYNGLAMITTFFVCRVLSLPYVCLMYSRVIGLSYFEAIKSLPTGCKISIGILLLPQLYWFYLMSAGACKVFFGSSKTKKTVVSGEVVTSKIDDENNAKKRS